MVSSRVGRYRSGYTVRTIQCRQWPGLSGGKRCPHVVVCFEIERQLFGFQHRRDRRLFIGQLSDQRSFGVSGEFMKDIAQQLEDLIAASERLRGLHEGAVAHRPATGKWSKKEILGHLVDSAANNHQRFVRLQLQTAVELPGYARLGPRPALSRLAVA